MNDDDDEDRNANDTCGEEGMLMFKNDIFVTSLQVFSYILQLSPTYVKARSP